MPCSRSNWCSCVPSLLGVKIVRAVLFLRLVPAYVFLFLGMRWLIFPVSPHLPLFVSDILCLLRVFTSSPVCYLGSSSVLIDVNMLIVRSMQLGFPGQV